ncbi:hypothetical protein TorRG33x02_278660 [Trema orientale]|uniref:Uncharacterized protein n=1 Tax=Trema orientale TaxID=63057 RepID=A0A2P5CNA9_TREOI|nr:hypothetical protein TorRG33x02_278660 [Trema orientale]
MGMFLGKSSSSHHGKNERSHGPQKEVRAFNFYEDHSDEEDHDLTGLSSETVGKPPSEAFRPSSPPPIVVVHFIHPEVEP